jgi:prolyl-tRNA synthetase
MSKEFSAKNADVRLEEARVGNVLGKVKSEDGAQDKHFAFMTRQAKIQSAQDAGILSASEVKSLKSLGDLQKWELKTLARLYQLGDNDPALMQILAFTKTDNREDCAVVVARKQYKKQLVENSISNLLSAEEVKGDVDATASSGRTKVGQHAFGL